MTSTKKFAPQLKRTLPTIFLMTSHLNSHGTTDIKPEMLSGVQTGNGTPHDKYNIRRIAHVCKSRKDDMFMQRRLVQSFTYTLQWGRGTCTLTKHTRRWTYSALRYFLTNGGEIPLYFLTAMKLCIGQKRDHGI